VRRAARLSEAAGHDALLIPSGNRLLDPWVVTQEVLRVTRSLRPIVTVQPLYMHPYAVSKKITSLARLYGRAPDLSLVAGASRNDLLALDDATPHDERYRRLTEYGLLIRELLTAAAPVVFEGEFYRVHRPESLGGIPDELAPRLLVAGTSAAGRAAADRIGAVAVHHPAPSVERALLSDRDCVHIGVLARPDADEAWRDARDRFTVDPDRRLRRRLEMRFTDSEWVRTLGQAVEENGGTDSPYWLEPFANGLTSCCYLVGDYATVAREIHGFLTAGVRTFLLDDPAGARELRHTDAAFRRAWARHTSPLTLTLPA
jgi:alkanesulfonate monooxygenase